MTYSVERIRTKPEDVATDLATFLNGASINTLHSINIQKFGSLFEIFVTYE